MSASTRSAASTRVPGEPSISRKDVRTTRADPDPDDARTPPSCCRPMNERWMILNAWGTWAAPPMHPKAELMIRLLRPEAGGGPTGPHNAQTQNLRSTLTSRGQQPVPRQNPVGCLSRESMGWRTTRTAAQTAQLGAMRRMPEHRDSPPTPSRSWAVAPRPASYSSRLSLPLVGPRRS